MSLRAHSEALFGVALHSDLFWPAVAQKPTDGTSTDVSGQRGSVSPTTKLWLRSQTRLGQSVTLGLCSEEQSPSHCVPSWMCVCAVARMPTYAADATVYIWSLWLCWPGIRKGMPWLPELCNNKSYAMQRLYAVIAVISCVQVAVLYNRFFFWLSPIRVIAPTLLGNAGRHVDITLAIVVRKWAISPGLDYASPTYPIATLPVMKW